METLEVIGHVELTQISIEARLEKKQWQAYMVSPAPGGTTKVTDQIGAAMKAISVPELVAVLKKEYPHWHFYPEKTPAKSK